MSVADNFTGVGSSPTGTMGSMRGEGYGSGGGGGGGGTVDYNLDGSLKTVMAEADSEQVLREQLTQLRELREEAEDQDAHIDRVERENASLRTCREGKRRRTVWCVLWCVVVVLRCCVAWECVMITLMRVKFNQPSAAFCSLRVVMH
jgi:hypothetical protein